MNNLELINELLLFCFVFFIGVRYKFNYWEWLLVICHCIICLSIDRVIPYLYNPDQYAYLIAAKDWRTLYECHQKWVTICAPGLFFAVFPVFLVSPKSIAIVNTILYLIILIFLRKKLNNLKIRQNATLFFLLYPSLFYYPSLGLRDIIVIALMYFALYYTLINTSLLKAIIFSIPLIWIKKQNLLIICFSGILFFIFRIRNKSLRIVMIFIFILSNIVICYKLYPQLQYSRMSMYNEPLGHYELKDPEWIWNIPAFNAIDIYRATIAPFFWDASKLQHYVQSTEDLLTFIIVVYLFRRLFSIRVDIRYWGTINYYLLMNILLYSYTVFNYGAISRYRFIFVIVWILIVLHILDKHQNIEQKGEGNYVKM